MRTFARNAGLSMLAVLGVGAATPAAAQTPGAELQIGYQLLHVPNNTFPVGWNIDLAGNLGPVFGIVGEVGGAHDSQQIGIVDLSVDLFNFGAGPRVNLRTNPRVKPYLQVMVGGIKIKASASAEVGGVNINANDSVTKFMLQPGGGVDIKAGKAWGVVGAIDYRHLFLDKGSDQSNEFRVLLGLRIDL